ncbi:MAG: hypothetical protein IJL87_02340 [Clostridia bacterium]|nr:hypothetical protein [Clostridia bacterium]
MRKKMIALTAVLFLALIFTPRCFAVGEQIARETRAFELDRALPDGTRENLEQSEISADNVNTDGIGDYIVSCIKSAGQKPMECGAKMIGLMLLSVLVLGVGESIKDRKIADVLGMVCGCACMLCLFEPLCRLAQSASEAVGAASTFSLAFTPVYGALLILAGKPATAAVFGGRAAAAGAFFTFLTKSVVVPACSVLLGFSVLSCAGIGVGGDKVAQSISKAVKWLMGICAVLFAGIISLNSAVAAGTDSLALRTAKFVISGSVPVIGSALGDAVSAVSGSVSAIKSGVGAFGIIAFAYIFIPVISQNIMWSAVIGFCSFAAEMLGLDNLKKTFSAAGAVSGMLLACELFSLTVIVISAGAVLS